MNLAEIIAYLKKQSRPFNELTSFSDQPGIYTISFWSGRFPLDEIPIKAGDIIYVGKTLTSQTERDLNQHFASGETGRSTLRRTLGAILRKDFGLKPIPRSQTENSGRQYTNYMFDHEGEKQLTYWMRNYLGLSFYEYSQNSKLIEELETRLIHELVPPLNLKDNPGNPYAQIIKGLRTKCIQLAVIASRQLRQFSQVASVKSSISQSSHSGNAPMKLHKVMEVILKECPDRTATFQYVSYVIWKSKLYWQKSGEKAPPCQIRLRAKKYSQFAIIPPNKVKLIFG